MNRRTVLTTTLVVAISLGAPGTARSCGGDEVSLPTIGTVCLTALNFCPVRTVPAEGQLLSVASNEALFSLLGDAYGGDGRTSFALPNLKGKEPAPGLRYCLVVEGIYPSHP